MWVKRDLEHFFVDGNVKLDLKGDVSKKGKIYPEEVSRCCIYQIEGAKQLKT